jgi:hypothetical protein
MRDAHAARFLYPSPPQHAPALCCDGKSQVQTLDRTQTGLPLKKGHAATRVHDCKRHGITTQNGEPL